MAIPTRTSADKNLSADINDLQAQITALGSGIITQDIAILNELQIKGDNGNMYIIGINEDHELYMKEITT